ncbi:autotransporter outer membrane beta-barrel domain-containing protein [Mesorhizobium sp. ESP7-2]|nr:autotransporter outer membrane beta-barrel domain-containing protein [Mesorhizobium sp. ESP7-2]MBZ9706309.1 autotransporter outer membrane beta-barrel domain-containing protein [Mesorhizobium sp. ESP7-2]
MPSFRVRAVHRETVGSPNCNLRAALSSASLIALMAMLASAPRSAFAANECGAPVGGVVTCSGSSYPAPGISYNVNGLTLILNNPNLVAQKTTAGTGAVAIVSGANNINDIVINALLFQSVQSTATLSNGIDAANIGTDGNAIVRMDTGTVTSRISAGGGSLFALIGNSVGAGNAQITLNDGQVINTGLGNGAYAQNQGTGNAVITMNGGSVSIVGAAGAGLRAGITNATSFGAASVTINGGTITANPGTGVLSQSELGSAGITMTAGTVTVQSGTNPALSAVVNNAAATATAGIAVSGGTVTNSGSGDGLFASNKGAGTYDIGVTGGTVTGGSGTGAAIHGDAIAGGTITIGSGATVNAGASGVALSQAGGAATITTAGSVTGNINLSAASNVLDITGGAINGNISGGGNSVLKFDLGSGSFTYGAAYTITGMNSTAMDSGSAEIDGSLATNTLAVNGGSLILSGAATVSAGTTISAGTLQLGNDGTSGSITGDVTNNGTLAFDRSDAYTFAGLISGTGGVKQIGSGSTVLTGTNSYAGPTTVAAGGLYVDGDQSAATGPTSVQIGAALGGKGTIGGNVAIADGATLSPGSADGTPGTLAIAGDLTLSGGSILNYSFGQANVAGGALNDLTTVGGNLVLDGTLNVDVPAGGSFGPGIYRVFDYSGTLTNNGLAIGSIPSSNTFVQTSVDHQVNLVNTAGLDLNYWDGDAGPKFDGTVNGGNGTWQGSSGNDNWTETTGVVNAAYSDGGFAIFAGIAGTVTVDNGLGQVTAAGMQFATDGYVIQGGYIGLVGPQSTIRVGDGTSAGAGYTATIASALSGDTQLVKTDAGTLVLTGTNSYMGGTAINGGTLRVSADANLGDAAGGLSFNGGTLDTTASFASGRAVDVLGQGTISTNAATTLTLDGVLSGAGALTKSGAGTLALTADSSGFTGTTAIGGGTVNVSGSLCGTVNVLAGGRLEGTGTVCDTTNATGGTIAAGNAGVPGTLTIAGNYTGNGGTLEIETVLGGDASATDRLVVTGDTAGTTTLKVANLGGGGAQTVEGIKIIDVGGTSAGTFSLAGDYVFQGDQAVVGGAYAYRLYKNGVSTPTDGDWYLRSALINGQPQPLYSPAVPIYEAYAGVLQSLNELGTLQQRIGNRTWGEGATPEGADVPGQGPVDGKAIWARIEAAHTKLDPKTSTSGTDYDVTTWKFQAGVDGQLHESQAGVLIGGIVVNYGTASSDVSSTFGVGSIKATGYGVGGSLTWFGDSGFYVDTQAQVTWYDSDIRSATLGTTLADGNNGFGYALSVESGQKVALTGKWSLTPQAQLAYSSVRFDTFTDKFGAVVSHGSDDSLVGRLGVSADYEDQWADSAGQVSRTHIYGIANLYYDFLDGTDVDVSGVRLISQNQTLWGGVGLGGSLDFGDGKYAVFGEAIAKTSLEKFGDSNSIGAKLGFSVRW